MCEHAAFERFFTVEKNAGRAIERCGAETRERDSFRGWLVRIPVAIPDRHLLNQIAAGDDGEVALADRPLRNEPAACSVRVHWPVRRPDLVVHQHGERTVAVVERAESVGHADHHIAVHAIAGSEQRDRVGAGRNGKNVWRRGRARPGRGRQRGRENVCEHLHSVDFFDARDRLPLMMKGRGASWNPQNRCETLAYAVDDEAERDENAPKTLYLRDPSRSIIATNDSPDVGFDASINPYRGCEHGCIYCYSRPTHEYLGFSAGLDFETKILVKEDAPQLLREELNKKSWEPKTIAISGVTDPYQPIERRLGITRGCIEVLADFRNPVGIITKNALVTRDVDVLGEMSTWNGTRVFLSVTSLDPNVHRTMEPRTSTPELRLEAIRTLSAAGIPVGVMVAPVVPGLTDHEMPAILKAARDAGAQWAGFVVLRLPWAVAPLFEQWLEENFSDRKDKVLNRVRDLRGGKLYDAQWGVRGRGEGIFAEQIEALFDVTCRKLGLNEKDYELNTSMFRRRTAQASLW